MLDREFVGGDERAAEWEVLMALGQDGRSCSALRERESKEVQLRQRHKEANFLEHFPNFIFWR